MNRSIERRYELSTSEVEAIIIAHLTDHGMNTPPYTGDSYICKWLWAADRVVIEWVVTDEVVVPGCNGGRK